MFIPSRYLQDDTAVAHDLISSNVFATLVTELQNKWKMSQNREADDRAGAVAALEELGGESNLAVAATMRTLYE